MFILIALLEILLAYAWALWLGSVVFFSFVVAPSAFKALEPSETRRLLRTLVPRYYIFGLICGGAALILCLTFRADLRISIPLAAAFTIVAYTRQRVLPAAESARDRQDDEQFRWLHRLSVQLNMIVLALLLLAGTLIAL